MRKAECLMVLCNLRKVRKVQNGQCHGDFHSIRPDFSALCAVGVSHSIEALYNTEWGVNICSY